MSPPISSTQPWRPFVFDSSLAWGLVAERTDWEDIKRVYPEPGLARAMAYTHDEGVIVRLAVAPDPTAEPLEAFFARHGMQW